MSLGRGLGTALAEGLGSPVGASTRVSGGDINETFRVDLADGRRVFIKTHPRAPAGMYDAEAAGLRWLAGPGALRVPEVLAVRDSAQGAPRFLALEYLESSRPVREFDEALGRGLAAIHRAGPPEFGFDRDNFIATLPQQNGPSSTWPEFYGERRLRPQVRWAVDGGKAPASLGRAVDRVIDRLPHLVGEPESPARLHGDLWGGNLHVGPQGEPCLIDPAVYAGHREVDLAMMRLFGGFGSRVFSAYGEAYALSPGAEERVSLYQLYPLLVHVNLFGGHYAQSAASAAQRYI